MWCTGEFGYLALRRIVQISSIMPQKRNPVALEHVRMLASNSLGEAQAVLPALHNTPFGDINDSEDDLQPFVYSAFVDASRSLDLAAGVLETARFDTGGCNSGRTATFLTVTELADVLVRSTGMSFRIAHEIVSLAVEQAGGVSDPKKLVSSVERFVPQ